MKKPKLIILAGPNGAGKSTFAEHKDLSFINELNIESFDYDLEFKKIYKQFISVMNAHIEENIADKTKALFEENAEKAIFNKTHFSFQTNYDKIYTDKWRLKFSEAGFNTELYFLYVDSIELCEQRVAKRVFEGGHNVSSEEIKKRYYSGLQNLNSSFEKFDKVVIINTSEKENKLLLEVNNSKITYLNETLVNFLYKNELFKVLKWIEDNLNNNY